MKLWVDADAAPRDAKEVIYRAARRLKLETILVANGPLSIPANADTVSTIQVAAGADVADRYIAEQSERGDIAVTADIPLASKLVEKGVVVIDPRGEEYTPANIRGRLAARDFMDAVRGAGIQTGGAAPYDAKDKKAFAGALDRALTRALKNASRS
ncbi:YaiI/YqxD family protein [Candidatus Laterigemmans baculatus]|uniref:YaiI/YqxD family protein n=1 Tax=Candidatus Laterigemmans baculatus TaxID=2770505 RepID=UPI0013DA38AF|nr:YaiI/YqxD family protein [Candidatus Laterigemmans baculatus]